MNACLTIAYLNPSSSPLESFFASPQPSVSFIIQDGGISDYSSLAQQNTPALQAMSTEQFLFQNYTPPSRNDNLRRQLDLLVLLIKKYIYSCKRSEVHPGCSQFINKLKIQWKMEIST